MNKLLRVPRSPGGFYCGQFLLSMPKHIDGAPHAGLSQTRCCCVFLPNEGHRRQSETMSCGGFICLTCLEWLITTCTRFNVRESRLYESCSLIHAKLYHLAHDASVTSPVVIRIISAPLMFLPSWALHGPDGTHLLAMHQHTDPGNGSFPIKSTFEI